MLSHQTDFRVTFLKDNPFPIGTKKSKAVGEPCVCRIARWVSLSICCVLNSRQPSFLVVPVYRPLLLAGSIWTAIRQAIMASRVERGLSPEFPLDCPASVDRIQTACAVDGAALTESLK